VSFLEASGKNCLELKIEQSQSTSKVNLLKSVKQAVKRIQDFIKEFLFDQLLL
jgi:hypothetical protein